MFSWGHFSKALLRDLAREKELRVTFAEEDLSVTYGSPPGSEFVDDLWPVLRDRWLDGTPTSRRTVVESLRAKQLGDKSVRIGEKAGQMKLLRSCRLSDNLRSIVLDEFVRVGSTDATAVQEAAAPNDDANRVEDMQDEPIIASAVIPTEAIPGPIERHEPATTSEDSLLGRGRSSPVAPKTTPAMTSSQITTQTQLRARRRRLRLSLRHSSILPSPPFPMPAFVR